VTLPLSYSRQPCSLAHLCGCMKSFRRTQVLTANIANMARVTSRIRWSLSVVHDKTPKTAYATNPSNKRFTTAIQLAPEFPHFRSGFRLRAPAALTPAKRLNTGAQGRIRTSVPRKEEQIYSLPALTTHPPVRCRLLPRPRQRLRKGADVAAISNKEDRCAQSHTPHAYTTLGNAS
jgi:hypothetical protein